MEHLRVHSRDERQTGVPMGPTGFPWERERESELDGNGNANHSTGMRIGQFPLKGKKDY
jgi:hypothetical protein